MTKIALFGTSADPPTVGHQAILSWLSQHYDWVAAWASDNPLKEGQTPLPHRATMLRLSIEDLNPPRHNIGLHQDISSRRTLETLEKAKAKWPGSEFTLVIGSDLVNQLPRWYRVEDLLRQVQLLVVPRPGDPIEEVDLKRLKEMGGKIAIASIVGLDISSTAYRENRNTISLTPTVQAYICREHLYSCQDATLKRLHIR